MASSGLTSGTTVLVDAAKKYIASVFQNPTVVINETVDDSLSWAPTLHFKVNDHLTVIVEASESPYPLIFNLRRQDVLRLNHPISVYCVCPEESYLKNQADVKRLIADGYGLITVASDGTALKRTSCIPLLQQITEEEFEAEIRGLPKKLRARLAEAFDRYKHNAPSGTTDVAEVFEGLVLRAGRDSVKKAWISVGEAKPGSPAKTLAAMGQVTNLKNAAAAIGAAQAFISMYRNVSHHFPKDKKQAAKKYRDCRHGFLEGLKKIVFFRNAMRAAGLSGKF